MQTQAGTVYTRHHHLVGYALKGAFIAGLTGLLAACGGGGGGDAPNVAPTAAFALQGDAVAQGTTVFNTTGTADSDGTVASITWNYGDGQTGASASHVYATTGTYNVTMTVTDNDGATASQSQTVTVLKCSVAGATAAAAVANPAVCMQTSMGEVVMELLPAAAPITVANFLKYVDDGFYANTIFHRVIAGFVAQGGGFTSGPTSKAPTYAPIALESNNGQSNLKYTVAMARTSVLNSATSQFYINTVDNLSLNHVPGVAGREGYAVFGRVIAGQAVVDAIGRVTTATRNNMADVPVTDVVVRSVVRVP